MSAHDRGHDGSSASEGTSGSSGAGSPGKRTRTESLQRRAAPGASTASASVAASATVSHDPFGQHLAHASVQRKGEGSDDESAAVHAVAQAGVSGSGGALPFADQIQRSFGAHDISDVRAHVGGEAASASSALGAQAYATGRDVAFGGAPDLHTAAHEAAHVVQQRAGVSLKGGVGESGDVYERHADAVADAVVAGQSAESILDGMVGSGGGGGAGVQRQAVQFWDGSEHRAFGNLGAILAMGNADFRTAEINRMRREFNPTRPGETFDNRDFSDGTIDFTGGNQATTDPTLVGLERRARDVNRVQTNDRHIADPDGGPGVTLPSSISFGAANEFGGDFAKSPAELAREHDSDDPVGNDFMVMVMGAESNINHFYPLNGNEYRAHHNAAIRAATGSFAASQAGNTAQANALIRQAMLEEGFAAHFLADTFAAGHMAPRGLDRISESGLDEGELGLNRSKHWHDALNEVTGSEGLPTTRGRFHGDDTMTGRELGIIGNDIGASLREVLTTAAGRPERATFSIPAPAVDQILATPDYGPIWRAMMGDYEQDLRAAERRGSRDTVTSDGGTTTNVREMAGDMRENIFGGERVALTRLASSEWNGATLNFSVTVDGRPAPAGTRVFVQFYDKDLGFDRAATGYTAGTIASDAGGGMNDTDEKIGEPTMVTVGEGGIGTITSPEDDAGDVYAVLFAEQSRFTPGPNPTRLGTFVPNEVPIGRTETQGTNRGRVNQPLSVSGLSWSGATLRFRVTANGEPVSGRTVYLRFYDKDAGFDRDERGNLMSDVLDSDEAIGGIEPITINGGDGWITATGDADDSGDTYAVIYLDAECRTPLARSPVMP
jgi:hypothetical protein